MTPPGRKTNVQLRTTVEYPFRAITHPFAGVKMHFLDIAKSAAQVPI